MVPANNASGNYFMGRPDGWEDMQDSVFVVSMLTTPGTVTVTSGGNTQSFSAPAGASAFQVPMAVGQQQFSLTRGSTTVLTGLSLKNISPICICGIYNFNAYVGTLPPGFSDPLGHDGLVSLTAGLHVSTCSATPSLGTAPAPPTTTVQPTTSSTAQGSTTAPTTSSTSSPSNPPTSTSTTPTQTTSSSTSGSTSGTCIAGTVAPGMSGNYIGLCNFACNYGYCPPGPCICTGYGNPIPTPPVTAPAGCPLPGEDNSYLGLCSFACSHGYCPATACSSSC
jgi:hypothetical protein